MTNDAVAVKYLMTCECGTKTCVVRRIEDGFCFVEMHNTPVGEKCIKSYEEEKYLTNEC